MNNTYINEKDESRGYLVKKGGVSISCKTPGKKRTRTVGKNASKTQKNGEGTKSLGGGEKRSSRRITEGEELCTKREKPETQGKSPISTEGIAFTRISHTQGTQGGRRSS